MWLYTFLDEFEVPCKEIKSLMSGFKSPFLERRRKCEKSKGAFTYVFLRRNPNNIFVAILEKRSPLKFILSLTDLYVHNYCTDGSSKNLQPICAYIS